MDLFSLILGVLLGGLIMYYIQPHIKIAVAKMFGWEAKVAQEYRVHAAALQAAAVAKMPTPPPTPSL